MEETTDNRPQEITDLFGEAPKTSGISPQEEPAKPLFGESASPVPGAVPLFGIMPPASSGQAEEPLFEKERQINELKEEFLPDTLPRNGEAESAFAAEAEKADSEPQPANVAAEAEKADSEPQPAVAAPAISALPEKPRGILHPSVDVEGMSLGSLMVSIREQAGITVEDAASITRIKRFYIESIEKDRFEDLPSGSLPYAYIRTLCNIYGVESELSEKILDKARTIKRTETEFPEKIISHVGSTITRNEKEEKRFMRLLLCAGAGIVLVLLIVIALVIWWLLPSGEKPNASSETGESSAVSSAVPGRTINDGFFDSLTAPALPKNHELPVPGKK